MRPGPLLVASWLGACGQSATPPAPVPAPPSPIPAVGPAPAVPQPAPPPAPPAAPSACQVDPPGGIVVATGRGRPRVLVGAAGALVVHSTRARPRYDPDEQGNWECTWADAIAVLSFPLSSAPPREVTAPWDTRGGCGVLQPDPVALLRRGEEPVAIACGNHPYSNWTCTTTRPFAPSAPAVSLPNLNNESTARASSFAFRDGTLFGAVATTDGRLMGYVAAEGRPAARGLLQTLRGGAIPAVEPRSSTEAAVTLVTDDAQATQVVMGPEATRVGEPATVPRPTPLGLPFEVAVEREPAPPHLRARAGGAGPLGPIAGIDPAAATFAPSAVAHGAGHLLVWSEGLGETTRIRAARFDAGRLALVSPAVEVSTPAREAGFAQVDASGGRAVVTWDEKNGTTWEIHAAELRCP